jgi:hypothetical protein
MVLILHMILAINILTQCEDRIFNIRIKLLYKLLELTDICDDVPALVNDIFVTQICPFDFSLHYSCQVT